MEIELTSDGMASGQWVESPKGHKMVKFPKTLPPYKEKEALLRAIAANQVIVVSGETGCGKTTHLPHYILESEIEAAHGAFCSIICTQPRRISAISVSERFAAESGEEIGESVLLTSMKMINRRSLQFHRATQPVNL